jgi:hypothetical protein
MSDAHDNTSHQQFPRLELVDVSPIRRASLIAAVLGIAGFAVLSVAQMSAVPAAEAYRDIFFTYLCGYVFWASLPFWALGLMMIAYVTQASWGIILRRMFQASTRTLPILAIFFLPVIASLYIADGQYSPYWWADTIWTQDHHNHEIVKEIAAQRHLPELAVEENMHKVHDFLNAPFFTARFAIYFVILGVIIYFQNAWSRPAEDHDDLNAKGKLRMLSAPGIIIWALTLTIAATDWVMSVEPTWASSMFPVIYGMNMFITTFALLIFIFYSLYASNDQVMGLVKDKFRIDMGSLMLAVTLVWAYGSFCQYMLIWAGNLPEEITYYLKRGNVGWEYLAYYLMIFHWIIPFACIVFRPLKTNPNTMRIICGLLLLACVGDVIWWLLPAVPRPESFLHVPMALAAIVGLGGLWGLYFARELSKRPIMPANHEGRFIAEWGHH